MAVGKKPKSTTALAGKKRKFLVKEDINMGEFKPGDESEFDLAIAQPLLDAGVLEELAEKKPEEKPKGEPDKATA